MLGFIPSKKVDLQDLKYDTSEFLRKLAWKAYFKANPDVQNKFANTDNTHKDIRISGFSHPNFTNTVLDDVKTKLFGWIANHSTKTPKGNLSKLELRGRRWLLDRINTKTIFISKADKGGAILIMNHNDVCETIEKELFNPEKFTN